MPSSLVFKNNTAKVEFWDKRTYYLYNIDALFEIKDIESKCIVHDSYLYI